MQQTAAGARHPGCFGRQPFTRAAATASLPSIQAFVDSIMQAIQGFLDEHAAAFAGQLWSFLQSGLSITAHDALLFGPEDAAPASSDADQAQEPEAAPSGAVAPEV